MQFSLCNASFDFLLMYDFAQNLHIIDGFSVWGTDVRRLNRGMATLPQDSVIFVLTYFIVLVAVFDVFFCFSFVLVFIIFSF